MSSVRLVGSTMYFFTSNILFASVSNSHRCFSHFSGRPIIVDFSPVTDFREATCRQYEENVCNRGGYCNFMHLKKISR